MKYWLSISIVLMAWWLGLVSCDTQNSVDPVFKEYFIKYYGEDGDQEGRDFVINQDGSVVIIGTTAIGQLRRLYLVKVDAEGNELWKKTLGSTSDEFAQDIEPITDGPDAGNFVILSNVVNSLNGFDMRLTVINTNGDSLKSFLIDQLASQEGKSVTPISDGGYFVSGKTTDTNSDLNDPNNANAGLPDPSSDAEDILVIRFQSDFSYFPFDLTRIGGSYTGAAVKVFQEGGVFFYAGHSDALTDNNLPDNNVYESNYFFRSFISNPGAVNSLYAGSLTLHEEMTAIAKSPSGTFMAVGTQTDLSGAGRRLYSAVINSNFTDVRGEKVIDDRIREAVAIAPAGFSGFLILANEYNAALTRDIYLRKTTVDFDVEFEVRFGAPGNDDTSSAVAELPNGDILILGTMNLTNQKKIALIKLRSNGQF
jgi:hypothetical protein